MRDSQCRSDNAGYEWLKLRFNDVSCSFVDVCRGEWVCLFLSPILIHIFLYLGDASSEGRRVLCGFYFFLYLLLFLTLRLHFGLWILRDRFREFLCMWVDDSIAFMTVIQTFTCQKNKRIYGNSGMMTL